jgi:hypothetical protein
VGGGGEDDDEDEEREGRRRKGEKEQKKLEAERTKHITTSNMSRSMLLSGLLHRTTSKSRTA